MTANTDARDGSKTNMQGLQSADVSKNDVADQLVRIGQLILVFSPQQLLHPNGEPVELRQQSLRSQASFRMSFSRFSR